jgi:peptidyl-tRNA hydrolase
MYIFVNSQAGMSAGKMAAQAAHAAVEAYRISRNDLIQEWYLGKHYTKLVMDGGDGFQLGVIQNYLESRSFASDLIIDEGRTEIEPFTPTALGVEIVDKDDPHTSATFESFKTLRPPRPVEEERRVRWWQALGRGGS